MNKYPKINSVYHRYIDGPNKGKFIIGEWADPVFEYLKDLMWVWKEQVDGTNIRVQYHGNMPLSSAGMKEYGFPIVDVKGKTDKTQRIEPLYSIVEKMFPPGWFQEHFDPGVDVCLYGEGYGAGINKGGKYRPDQSFVLFDIKIGHWWLKNDAIADIARAGNIEHIPAAYQFTLTEAINKIKGDMFMRSAWGVFAMEGLVGQPIIPLNIRNGQRVVVKIKTKDFIQEGQG